MKFIDRYLQGKVHIIMNPGVKLEIPNTSVLQDILNMNTNAKASTDDANRCLPETKVICVCQHAP